MSRARWLVAALAVWTAAQGLWLRADHRITEGDVIGNVGALELFHQEAERSGLATVLWRAWSEDFGEYPALAPALQGWATHTLGVTDLAGDGPAAVGLGWVWLLIGATWALGRRFGDRGFGAALLLLSPWVAGLGRHVLLEVPMAALVTLAAALAAGAAGLGEEEAEARWGRWVACGLAAGLALLTKQTAVLALAPLALIAVRRGRGLLVAGAVAAAVAGPWYLRRFGAEGAYLLRSAEANPDAVGWLHQLAVYPLALAQLPWGLWGLGALVAGGLIARSTPGRGWAPALLMLLPLLLLPKKYPRLLLPILPVLAVWLGAWMATWPARVRGAVLGVLAVGWAASFVGLEPTMRGLTGLDERCAQRWVRAPHPEGVDFAGITDALRAHGGAHEGNRVGALDWPVPPCEHQTTLDLGEHLRIAARRAGLELQVEAGASRAQGGWQEGPPELILHAGALPECPGCGPLEEVGRWPLRHPDWPLDLRLSRRAW